MEKLPVASTRPVVHAGRSGKRLTGSINHLDADGLGRQDFHPGKSAS
jgi:hypothetical protein